MGRGEIGIQVKPFWICLEDSRRRDYQYGRFAWALSVAWGESGWLGVGIHPDKANFRKESG